MYIMKTKIKIIKSFLEDRKPKTIREIAKSIHADYKITYTAAQRLIEQNILTIQTVGKSSWCGLNAPYYGLEIDHAEKERTENFLANSSLRQLYTEIMAKVDTSFFILILFGSYAKGQATKSSDIDLLFIVNDKEFEGKIHNILSLLPLKIHALVFTEEEFIRMKNAQKTNVVHEIIEKNIILYGIEAYYQLKKTERA